MSNLYSKDAFEAQTAFLASEPHCEELGLELTTVEPGGIIIQLPYSDKIIGNPETGVIHSGALSTLMDQTLGSAVVCALHPVFDIPPTIDLRISHMKMAEVNRPIFCSAQAYRITKNVAFSRGVAYQTSKDDPVCYSEGTYLRMGFSDKQAQWASKPITPEKRELEKIDLVPVIKNCRESGDYLPLIERLPYARFLGISYMIMGEELVFVLKARNANVGNPTVPALHGGVECGFMEHSAMLYLMVFLEQPDIPKIIDFTIDYLRSARLRETYCECRMVKLGRRVANVTVKAWQTNRDNPIASARANFLLNKN